MPRRHLSIPYTENRDCILYKCRPISIILLWHIVYWVNLQRNSYWFTHLTYILLLHYLGKHSDYIQSYQPKLHMTVTQSKTTFSLSTQPVRVQVQLLQLVFKMSSFFIHKGLPPFVNSIVHNAVRQTIPCVDQALSQIGYISIWRLIHTILHHAPYSIVNRTMIRTTRRPEVRRNEFRSLKARFHSKWCDVMTLPLYLLVTCCWQYFPNNFFYSVIPIFGVLLAINNWETLN